jgi:hypothetical protein
MTEGRILLEVLSNPDWSNKLQEEGVKVNKETLLSIHDMLVGMESPKPSDYNPAVRNFNDTLDKSKIKDVAVLKIEPVGLKAGVYLLCNPHDQHYYGRFMTLTDPEGRVHHFNTGPSDAEIAAFTSKCIELYQNRYATQYVRHYAQQGINLTAQQIEHYKHQYNKGEALTENQVKALRQGDNSHGWNCTRLTMPRLEERVYYTDKGSKIYATVQPYDSHSRKTHDRDYPSHTYRTLEDPTSKYNCFSDFIGREAWLIASRKGEHPGIETQIQTILTDNGYEPVDDAHAQIDDIVAYYKNDGSNISHIGTVAQNASGGILVESKPGDAGLIQHWMHDPGIRQKYGMPIIYHTNRTRRNLLLSEQEWEAVTSQASSGYPNQSGW